MKLENGSEIIILPPSAPEGHIPLCWIKFINKEGKMDFICLLNREQAIQFAEEILQLCKL